MTLSRQVFPCLGKIAEHRSRLTEPVPSSNMVGSRLVRNAEPPTNRIRRGGHHFPQGYDREIERQALPSLNRWILGSQRQWRPSQLRTVEVFCSGVNAL